MTAHLLWRLITRTDPRLLAAFAWKFGWKGMRAVSRFEKRIARGEYFPAFLFLSVTNACNLRCQGCWVTQTQPPVHLPADTVHRIIDESRREGCSFFGIMGGEPLLYDGLIDLFMRHRDCYFQLFTNGTLLTGDVARALRRAGNVTPLISIEGLERVSDERRGGENVYRRALDGLAHCRAQRLIAGVATSVCASNIDDVTDGGFVQDMIDRGAQYLWYYIYRPVGEHPAPELALSREQILRLRRFIVHARVRWPIIIVDAYWDAEGRALCPAATGISHHVSPAGDIEPCPPVQFAGDNVGDGAGFAARVKRSTFLAAARGAMTRTSRGCILLDDPASLAACIGRSGARDSSGRGTGLDELRSMRPCASHHIPGGEMPEKSWLYRFAKKRWFFGFGAYG
ncbi:radical SAM protein [bacterium]|nr:radical SAM protein [bacterium]